MANPDHTLAGAVATQSQRYFALLTCMIFSAATALFFPFASASWASIPAFFPVYQTVTAACYLLATWLLLKDYVFSGSRSLLVLAGGCLFTAFILLTQLLSVPGVLMAGRVLGGDQSTIHLWMWWHLGPAIYAALYALAERKTTPDAPEIRLWGPIWAVASAAGAFFVVLALITRWHDLLPRLNEGADYSLIVSTGIGPAVTLLCAVAALAVWITTRGKTLLQLWLVVSLVALVLDNLITMAGGRRDSVGWYIGRMEALMSAATLVGVYLHQLNATARRAASMAMALQSELDHRKKSEAAELQNRRLEDLGQLTGSVAHDFGNLLQVLSGSLTIIKHRASDEVIRAKVEVALRHVGRGEALIKQLLTFARRQPLRVGPVHLNQLVTELSDSLREALPGIQLQFDLAEDIGWASTDANELEQALLNLAMNARDAMPAGGTLAVVTRNAVAGEVEGLQGEFVVLAVRDTGAGIPPDVLARVWEPFFTTKPAGKGTGLGLATVHGFLSQCAGKASIDSKVGHGTTVSLFLPRGAPRSLVETGQAQEVTGRSGHNVLPFGKSSSAS